MDEDWIKGIISIVVIIVIFIPLMSTIASILQEANCLTYKTQIDQLQTDKRQLQAQLEEANLVAGTYKAKYENLTSQNITKLDFIEIKTLLNLITSQLNATKSEVYYINEQIISIKNIRNTYIALSLFVSLNFILFGLTFLDLVLFKFKYSKKIIDKIFSIRNKTTVEIRNQR